MRLVSHRRMFSRAKNKKSYRFPFIFKSFLIPLKLINLSYADPTNEAPYRPILTIYLVKVGGNKESIALINFSRYSCIVIRDPFMKRRIDFEAKRARKSSGRNEGF